MYVQQAGCWDQSLRGMMGRRVLILMGSLNDLLKALALAIHDDRPPLNVVNFAQRVRRLESITVSGARGRHLVAQLTGLPIFNFSLHLGFDLGLFLEELGVRLQDVLIEVS